MSERVALPYSPSELESNIVETVGPRGVLVGSAALYLAFPEAARQPRDIDMSFSKEDYPHVRERVINLPDWRELVLPDGRPWLTNGTYDISIGWGMKGMEHESLARRGWETESGDLTVGSSIDITPWKLYRNELKDQEDNDSTREFLHDITRPPLSEHLLGREIAMVKSVLLELGEDTNAATPIRLAANGLFTVFSLYGDPELKYPGQIIGELEKREYQVPALYHNGFDLLDDMRALIMHLQNIGASNDDILDGIVALAYADSIYGNGREKDAMPGGHDEYRSAALLRAHALSLGYSPERAERLFTIVEQTGFDEATKLQKGKNHPDPVVRAVCAVDLWGLSKPSEDLFDICVEDIISARYSKSRVLGEVAIKHGLRILSLEQGFDILDRYGNERLGGPTVKTPREALLARLKETTKFHENHQYPPDWTLDDLSVRLGNANRLKKAIGHMESHPTVPLADIYELY